MEIFRNFCVLCQTEYPCHVPAAAGAEDLCKRKSAADLSAALFSAMIASAIKRRSMACSIFKTRSRRARRRKGHERGAFLGAGRFYGRAARLCGGVPIAPWQGRFLLCERLCGRGAFTVLPAPSNISALRCRRSCRRTPPWRSAACPRCSRRRQRCRVRWSPASRPSRSCR